MLLAQGTATQIVVAMFISFCWLIGHLIIQAYKETADSWLQTCSMLGIFLSLWLGLIIKVGIVDELDLPISPLYLPYISPYLPMSRWASSTSSTSRATRSSPPCTI